MLYSKVTFKGRIQGDLVEVTITFSDDEGLFVESIDSDSILIGNQSTVVEILSTTASSVTAKFSVNSTALALGTNQIKSGQITVQNRWLYPMQPDLIIGEFVLGTVPPQSQVPVAIPTAPPVTQNQPTATPSGKVSGGSPLAITNKWLVLCFIFWAFSLGQ